VVTRAGGLDPVTVEVVGSALSSIVEEMGETLVRASYSTNIKERRDCSTALFDREGRTLAQAEHIPIHLGSLMGIVEEVRRRHPLESIAEGDAFLGNDAYTGGGTHLPDLVLATPIFVDHELVAWATNLAHHADFVDRAHSHIYQEGLRIPPVRLQRRGELQQDVLDLILLNCQVPHERRSDLRAQLAANRLGTQRLQALCGRYGAGLVLDAGDALLDYAERRMRTAIAALPDGEYAFEDRFDSEELDTELTLRVRVEVRGDEIDLDFDGNPPQVRAGLNLVETALRATVYYAIKSLLDPDVLPNAGLQRPIHVSAPPGTILNAAAPGAVNSRTQTCQRVVDLVYGALAEAVPERVIGACTGSNTSLTFSGVDPRTGRYYVYLETMGGGFGARATRDGLDGVQTHVTNTSNLPVEALEPEHPLLVERYELAPDSGGAGRQRGGMGQHRRLRVVGHEAHVQASTSRRLSAPWGVFGGQAGGRARVEVGEGVPPLSGGRGNVPPGGAVSIVTAGAGGYGPPGEREPERVRRDLEDGRISPWTAKEVYGLGD
jgi:N-methylhydantoinase B